MGNLTAEAFLIAISGIITVFLMLAVLCLLIPVTSKVIQFFENRGKKVQEQPQQVSSVQPVQPSTQSTVVGGEVKLIDVDEKTAACVMAIVSHETGIQLSELVFHQIRAVGGEES